MYAGRICEGTAVKNVGENIRTVDPQIRFRNREGSSNG